MEQTEKEQSKEKQTEELRWEYIALEKFKREVEDLRARAVEDKQYFDYGLSAGLEPEYAHKFAAVRDSSKSFADALSDFLYAQDGITFSELGFSTSFCDKYQKQVDPVEDIKAWAITFAVKEAKSKQSSSEAEE